MTTYGRTIIRNQINLNKFQKRLFASWGICLVTGLVIGTIGTACYFSFKEEPKVVQEHVVKEITFDWKGTAKFVPLDVPMNKELQQFVWILSYAYNVDFPLVMAVINQESSFRTDVVSDSDDHGLMQINKVNHEWLNETLKVSDFLNPYQNVRAGIFILGKLVQKYEEPSKALMAYNLGETGAKRLWEKGIFETNYTKAILAKAADYEKQVKQNGEN